MWRLNTSLLSHPYHQKQIASEIENYFAVNTDSVNDPTHLWNAHKAFLSSQGPTRGKNASPLLIAYQTAYALQKQPTKQQPSQHLDKELRSTRRTLSEHLHNNINLSLKRLCLHFYTHNNKPGACLARQLKGSLTQSKISYLTSSSGTRLTNSKDIANQFSSFFANLYNLSTVPAQSQEDIAHFLDQIQLPSISSEQLQTLSAPFSLLEIEQAIASLPLHKAPGPVSIEYYKQFADLLTPHLCHSFNHIASTGSIPSESLEATITTILKPGKPSDDPDSYRPISLLNTDTKLYAKLLTTHLSSIIPHLIYPDQVGFVAGRQASDGTR